MKHLILSLCVASACASAVAASDASSKPAKPRVEVCFVLDTTSSMTGLIEGAKQKIWSIANDLIAAKPAPDIRIGLVAYRDRGDEYVTRVFDLSADVDDVYAKLRSFQAVGGGDMPESVNEALQDAVTKVSWSADKKVLKLVFLVGDSPPHMDYAGGPKYPDVCRDAVKKDLIINTVQCGTTAETTPVWQEIAKLSEGAYAAIAQSGNMAAIATPMDSELAELNRKLGGTLVAYGSDSTRRMVMAKQVAAEAAPASVAADRLTFNRRSGVAVQGEGELLDSLNSGKVKLESLDKDQLPTELRTLDRVELKAELEKKQKERADLQLKIDKLSRDRDDYIAAERQRLAAGGKADSFDEKVAAAVHEQAARKGINYK